MNTEDPTVMKRTAFRVKDVNSNEFRELMQEMEERNVERSKSKTSDLNPNR